MSAIAFLIAVAIAFVATLVWTAVTGAWTARAIAGMFLFALAILIVPGVLHA